MSLNIDDIYDEAKVYKKQQVVQIVNTKDGAVATTTTVMPEDDTIPQNTEGGEFMTLAITPKNTANILKIDVSVNLSHSGNNDVIAALFQDSTADALAAAITQDGTNNLDHFITFSYYMTAGTTSATTFKVRCGAGGAGTLTFNGASSSRKMGGVMASSITITEYQPS